MVNLDVKDSLSREGLQDKGKGMIIIGVANGSPQDEPGLGLVPDVLAGEEISDPAELSASDTPLEVDRRGG